MTWPREGVASHRPPRGGVCFDVGSSPRVLVFRAELGDLAVDQFRLAGQPLRPCQERQTASAKGDPEASEAPPPTGQVQGPNIPDQLISVAAAAHLETVLPNVTAVVTSGLNRLTWLTWLTWLTRQTGSERSKRPLPESSGRIPPVF